MGEHIYNLNAGEIGMNSFYQTLSKTTSDLLGMLLDNPAIVHISEFRSFIAQEKIEPVRSLEEYLVEYIMIGLYWEKYSGYASALSGSVKKASDILFSAGQNLKAIKEPIDKLRGMLAYRHLVKKDNSYELVPIVENLYRLIQWLDATKDFNEEVKRLKKWHLFLKAQTPIYNSRFLGSNKEITNRFFEIARKNLDFYTQGVTPFLEKTKKNYKHRDDFIFCSRPEDEYIFNMIAANILNRAQREEFENATRKVVLLPDCMTTGQSGVCQPSQSGETGLQCGGCKVKCQIDNVQGELEMHGMEVLITSHENNLSRLLSGYAGLPGTSILGVTCVLKVLSDGYKIRSLGIPSQMLFLDYCSCKKHWPGINQPTRVNREELFRLLDIATPNRISNLEMILN